MRARSPHAFFIYFLFFCLRRPASRRWTATRSRTLTSRKMLTAFFRSLLLRKVFIFCCFARFFCLRRPASRRWIATRSWTLTSRKMLTAFFRNFCCFARFLFFVASLSFLQTAKSGALRPVCKKNAMRRREREYELRNGRKRKNVSSHSLFFPSSSVRRKLLTESLHRL